MSAIVTLSPTRRRMIPFDIILCLLVTYFVWSTTYLAIRYALVSIPPFLQVGSRFVVAGGLMMGFLLLRGGSLPTRKQGLNAALVGTLLMGGGMGMTAFAEQWVTSGLTATFIAVIPLWTALWSWLFGQKPRVLEWLGIAIGFAGVLILMLDGNLSGSPMGLASLTFATLCWSLGTVVSRRVELPAGPMGFSSEMLIGGALLFLAGWLRGEQVATPILTSAALAWVYLVIAGSLIAFSAYMYLVARVRPALATSYAYVNPVLAVALGAFMANEPVTPYGIVGMVIILAGVAVIALAQKK